MKYYKVLMNETNKVWKKYIIFAERFLYNNVEINKIGEKISLRDMSILNNLTIQALDNNGDIVYDQNKYKKDILPNFAKIRNLFLIKDDVYNEILFENIPEIETFTVKLDGQFTNNYKLVCFKTIIDCIDNTKSIKKQFESLSRMVVDKTKIPENINGFFLSGWDEYGKYLNIVNENIMEKLLKLNKASDFLVFKEIIYE
ncbi:hypothetical protein ACYULU_00995 [Breznakiellaceae bacterium SP9]